MTMNDALSRVRPVIEQHKDKGEVERDLPSPIMDALVDSQLLRLWIPKDLGGLEAEPNESLAVLKELARLDPSTGWVASNCVLVSMLHQFLPNSVLEETLGNPKAVIVGSFVPPGTVRATSSGYKLSGRWSFGSGLSHATSVAALAVLVDDSGPVLGPGDAPTSVLTFVQPSEVTAIDTWYTLGLRGTGSCDFTCEDVAVPQDHTYTLGPWEPRSDGPFTGPLYRMGLVMDAARIGSVAVGIAQGALEDFVDVARNKTPAYTAVLTADRGPVQERVARARALIEASDNTLWKSVDDGWKAVQDGPRLCGESSVSIALASSFALDSCTKAMDLLYESSGSTGFRDKSPLQKRFRDLQTLRQNAIASWSRFEDLGKMMMGRTSPWPFHNL